LENLHLYCELGSLQYFDFSDEKSGYVKKGRFLILYIMDDPAGAFQKTPKKLNARCYKIEIQRLMNSNIMALESTLHLLFKKLPIVEVWCHMEEEYT
jgi:hypothetical protein